MMTNKVVKSKLLTVKARSLKLSRKNTTSMNTAELQAQIDRVTTRAMANVGTLTFQIEALKRSLPSDLPTVLAGPVKRHR
jgi:hypothetical protein